MVVYDWMWWGHLTNQNLACRDAQRCMEGCMEVCGDVWKCAIDINTLPVKQETVCPIYYLVPLCKSGSHSVMRQELRHVNM